MFECAASSRTAVGLRGRPPIGIFSIQIDKSKWYSDREGEVITLLLNAWIMRDLEKVERIVNNRTGRSLRSRAVVIVKRAAK
jgi:hypothetical protein